ncbi:MAG: DUF2461 family protein, partial [Bacteroidia bacterium]|nr:DUF2461 family protein [Bacteroidia bacterium]
MKKQKAATWNNLFISKPTPPGCWRGFSCHIIATFFYFCWVNWCGDSQFEKTDNQMEKVLQFLNNVQQNNNRDWFNNNKAEYLKA